MKNGEIDLVINTPEGHHARLDSYSIRRTAVTMGIPYFTTMAAVRAAVEAIQAMQHGKLKVESLQEYHGEQFEVQRAKLNVQS
jgi:carbamoyl-phosphate synthase large subunit